MQVTTLGIDLAKNVFYVHGCDANGKAVVRKQLSRRQLLNFVANFPPCLVAMEACASAHYWAREIEKLGHRVRLIAPRLVRPYVKANKNDASDAEAICEAASRPSMRFVVIKSAAQQDVQAVHRVRQQLVKARTGLANQVRGLLAEHGIVLARGLAPLRRALPLLLEDRDNGLSAVMRELLSEIGGRLRFIDDRLRQYDLTIQRLFRHDERCQRVAAVEGVGPLTATALVAAVGNATDFRSGRELNGLSRTGATPSGQRRAHGAAGDQQTWRSLSAHAADSRCALGPVQDRTTSRRARQLGRPAQASSGSQCGGSGTGQQE